MKKFEIVARDTREGGPAPDAIAAPGAGLVDRLERYRAGARSTRTRDAYGRWWTHYTEWYYEQPHTIDMLPMAGRVLAYLDAHVNALSIPTLCLALVAIRRNLAEIDHGNSLSSPAFRETWRGMRRAHARPARQARALTVDHLMRMVASCGRDREGVRDRAILLIGFFGGFRRGELVLVDADHLTFGEAGVEILVPRGKTDQEAAGLTKAIPYGVRPDECPVRALEVWIRFVRPGDPFGISGPVFTGRRGERLTGKAINDIVQRRAALIGLPAGTYSAHSLRSGFVTAAHQAGARMQDIMSQTGHRSHAVCGDYIRAAERWTQNAAAMILAGRRS